MKELVRYLLENMYLDFQGEISLDTVRQFLRTDDSREARQLLQKLIEDKGVDELLLTLADCLKDHLRIGRERRGGSRAARSSTPRADRARSRCCCAAVARLRAATGGRSATSRRGPSGSRRCPSRSSSQNVGPTSVAAGRTAASSSGSTGCCCRRASRGRRSSSRTPAERWRTRRPSRTTRSRGSSRSRRSRTSRASRCLRAELQRGHRWRPQNRRGPERPSGDRRRDAQRRPAHRSSSRSRPRRPRRHATVRIDFCRDIYPITSARPARSRCATAAADSGGRPAARLPLGISHDGRGPGGAGLEHGTAVDGVAPDPRSSARTCRSSTRTAATGNPGNSWLMYKVLLAIPSPEPRRRRRAERGRRGRGAPMRSAPDAIATQPRTRGGAGCDRGASRRTAGAVTAASPTAAGRGRRRHAHGAASGGRVRRPWPVRAEAISVAERATPLELHPRARDAVPTPARLLTPIDRPADALRARAPEPLDRAGRGGSVPSCASEPL